MTLFHLSIAVLLLFTPTLAYPRTRIRNSTHDHPFDRNGEASETQKNPQTGYPFVVRIIKSINRQEEEHVASGCIISPTIILTLCHAFFETIDGHLHLLEEVSSYKVIAGDKGTSTNAGDPIELNSTGTVNRHLQVRSIHRIDHHRDCFMSQDIFRSDAAVFILKKTLKWSLFVSPVKIFGYTEQRYLLKYEVLQAWNSACSLFGWHRKPVDGDSYSGESFDGVADVRAKGNLSGPLMEYKGRVQLVSDEECNFLFCSRGSKSCKINFTAESLTCAIVSNFQSPPCGDFGGPLICNGYLYGVATTTFCYLCEPVILTKPSVIWDLVQDLGTHQNGDLDVFLSTVNMLTAWRLIIALCALLIWSISCVNNLLIIK